MSTAGSRLSSVVGVARRMKLRPAFSAGRHNSSSSSGGRSTTIRPSTPARLGVGEKAFDAVDIDRIVVAHQHDRRRVVAACGSRAPAPASCFMFWPARERAQAGGLDRRPVRHRIGKRHAELDDIGAGLRQRLEDRQRGVVIRIAGHDEGHERGAAFRLAARRSGGRCGWSSRFALPDTAPPMRDPCRRGRRD